MIRNALSFVLAGSVVVAVCVTSATTADAQCCATPTVAYYQPAIAYQPVVAYQQPRMGLFDRMRMRRWGVTPVQQPVYATSYAAPYTAAYTPYQAAYAYAPTSYTAAYAPANYTAAYAPAVYTAAYRPYVTSYAPLATTTYYSVARQVVMSPVASACGACGCEPCGCAQPACSSCDSGVSQAIYAEPASGCSSCAGASALPSYSEAPTVGPATPQPQLAPSEGTPSSSQYETNKLQIDEKPIDPAPAPAAEGDSSTYFEAPKLFSPQDRTANRPSVDVHDAVYRQPATYQGVSQASAVEVDANGWYAVSGDR